MKVAILVSGRGSNMKALLERCRDGSLGEVCEPVVVFADDPDAAGLETAQELGIPTACVPSRGRKRRAFSMGPATNWGKKATYSAKSPRSRVGFTCFW